MPVIKPLWRDPDGERAREAMGQLERYICRATGLPLHLLAENNPAPESWIRSLARLYDAEITAAILPRMTPDREPK